MSNRNVPVESKRMSLEHVAQDGLVMLLTLTWDDGIYSGVLRLCFNPVDVVSRGETFQRFVFSARRPNEDDTDRPVLKIEFDDPTKEIRTEIRKLLKPATALLELVLLEDTGPMDAVQVSIEGKIRTVDISQDGHISMGVYPYEELADAAFPAWVFSPGYGFKSVR